jgi:dihydrofolate reductase
MANVLYMAISQDGFIATNDDKAPWSEDEWLEFQSFVKTCEIVILGKRTFQIIQAEDNFIEGPEYLVATHDKSLDSGNFKKLPIDKASDMPQAGKIGIIGGGELNGRLAKLGVIDEIILDIEPVALHDGIRLFGAYEIPLKLELLGSKRIGEATIQRHYKIIK